MIDSAIKLKPVNQLMWKARLANFILYALMDSAEGNIIKRVADQLIIIETIKSESFPHNIFGLDDLMNVTFY